jgi:aspartate-semialdehyde dehydrogenase
MIESVRIVGARGRVGSAVSARLAERGIPLD